MDKITGYSAWFDSKIIKRSPTPTGNNEKDRWTCVFWILS